MTARPLAVGDVIHGFAYGAFGRDHYDCVRIEAVGPDWLVARDPDNGRLVFASGRRALGFLQAARDEPCSNASNRQLDGDTGACCAIAAAEAHLTDWKATS